MNVTFACPACQSVNRVEIGGGQDSMGCVACGQQLTLPAETVASGEVRRCLACPSKDLFVRKDFPQRLGVAIVAVGVVLSTIAWGYERPILTYMILFATALIDLALYVIMPDALMCYRCGAMYRGVDLTAHDAFSLETHERYRQQAARLAERSASDSLRH